MECMLQSKAVRAGLRVSGRGLLVLARCCEQGKHEREKASTEVFAYGPGVTCEEEQAG